MAKSGPKLREASADEPERASLAVAGSQDVGEAKRAAAAGGDKSGGPPQPLTLVAQKISMPRLAELLQLFAHGHVKDATDLKGLYDLRLIVETGQTISGPLQEQLGLRLEPRKIPVETSIVDYAEKPAAN